MAKDDKNAAMKRRDVSAGMDGAANLRAFIDLAQPCKSLLRKIPNLEGQEIADNRRFGKMLRF